MVAVSDMTGKQVGFVTVISRSESIGCRAAWLCVCSCGNKFVRAGIELRKGGENTSCGCMLSAIRSASGKKRITHGYSRGQHRKLYDVYRQMLRRCNNPACKDYPRYGGRGVGVKWPDIGSFVIWAMGSGYREGLTIERCDVNGDYEPENCTWIENEKQSLNWVRSVKYTYQGKTQDIRSWADEYGINYTTLRGRLYYYGWSVERALTTPIKR